MGSILDVYNYLRINKNIKDYLFSVEIKAFN